MTAKSENTAVRIAFAVFAAFMIIVLVGVLLPRDRYGYPSALSYLFVQVGSILAFWSLVALCIVLVQRRSRKRQHNVQQVLDNRTAGTSDVLTSVSRQRVRTAVSLYALLRAVIPLVVFFVTNSSSPLAETVPLAFSDFPFTAAFIAVSLGVWRKWKNVFYYSRWVFALVGVLQGWGTLEFNLALTAGSQPFPAATGIVTVIFLLGDVSMFVYLSVLRRRNALE